MQGCKRKEQEIPGPIYELLSSKWCTFREISKCLEENNLRISKKRLLRILDNSMCFAMDENPERYKIITPADYE